MPAYSVDGPKEAVTVPSAALISSCTAGRRLRGGTSGGPLARSDNDVSGEVVLLLLAMKVDEGSGLDFVR